MKKIFTSIFCLGAVMASSAQNFTVSGVGGTTYNDGDVANVGYTPSERPGRYDWDPELRVTVENATSMLKTSTFTVTATANTPNIVQFCGDSANDFGGECKMITENPTSHTGTVSVNTTFSLGLDILAASEIITEPICVNLTITDGVQTTNLTINFLTTEQAGISAPTVTEAALKISGRTLTYNVESRTNLTLYNISGRAVINRHVNNAGTISLDGLHSGVYVYRLGEMTGKILVR